MPDRNAQGLCRHPLGHPQLGRNEWRRGDVLPRNRADVIWLGDDGPAAAGDVDDAVSLEPCERAVGGTITTP
jgi:hypothetical protein